MSGATIGGVVGAAIGLYFGNPQLGWMIGSAIGGYVDPEVITGPRLQDARTQTSRDGVAIPFGWGAFPVAGNIIWQQVGVDEVKHEDDGKGGPVTETFTYHRSFAVGICEGPITGILIARKNGKTVLDQRSDDVLLAEYMAGGMTEAEARNRIASQRAENGKFLDTHTFYLGTEGQTPDPTIESHLGVGNVPAYRGLVYMVGTFVDVTDLQGAIPQYEFVVSGGEVTTEEPATECGDVLEFGGGEAFPTVMTIELGECVGWVAFSANPGGIPDKFVIEMDGEEVYNSGYVGSTTFQAALDAELTSRGLPLETIGPGTLHLDEGDPVPPPMTGNCNGPGDEGCEIIISGFYKTTRSSTATIKVYAPLPDTGWAFVLDCPDSGNLPPGWNELPDWTDWIVSPDGELFHKCDAVYVNTIEPGSVPLSEIVANLCEREGLTSDEYDVSELEDDLVPGFRVANEGDAASAIAPLMRAYQFDVGEWDGKVRFVKRGGTAVASINGDDLVERDGGPFERERIQEVELLRRVTVGYIDPAASYGPTTQKWERRVGTVQAKGEASFELPLTLTADYAATTAKRMGLVAWGEPEKQKFSLPYRLAALTPTDVINYTDDDGEVYHLRLMQIEDDGGIREIESADNCAEAYNATATGVAPIAPTPGGSTLIGPTRVVLMDLPIWRTSDADDVGVYVAAAGYLGGWRGARIDVSVDDGANYITAGDFTTAATIGYTTTDLEGWVDSETPEAREVTVFLPSAPSSVDYETLLRYSNRAAIQLDDGSWSILQYQTVTALGDDLYTLSGLVLGRYATTPGDAAAGAVFVLLNSAVAYQRLERDYLDSTLTIRATSHGTSSDAATPFEYEVPAAPASQTEWQPHGLTGTRDGSDNVSVEWIGRARLGTETSPYHSTHFRGYRVTYSDGVDSFDYDVTPGTLITGGGTVYVMEVSTHEYTSAMQTADFGSVPGSLTVTVAALNDITGAGPASAGITV